MWKFSAAELLCQRAHKKYSKEGRYKENFDVNLYNKKPIEKRNVSSYLLRWILDYTFRCLQLKELQNGFQMLM